MMVALMNVLGRCVDAGIKRSSLLLGWGVNERWVFCVGLCVLPYMSG